MFLNFKIYSVLIFYVYLTWSCHWTGFVHIDEISHESPAPSTVLSKCIFIMSRLLCPQKPRFNQMVPWFFPLQVSASGLNELVITLWHLKQWKGVLIQRFSTGVVKFARNIWGDLFYIHISVSFCLSKTWYLFLIELIAVKKKYICMIFFQNVAVILMLQTTEITSDLFNQRRHLTIVYGVAQTITRLSD